ncbi:MAG: hypothetical protein ACI9EF_001539 [Pseudohongiellaceae bacterium]|jgi:hypothetical protein
MTQPVLPDRPLARFLALFDALLADKSWYDDATAFRFAASSLITSPGDPGKIANQLRSAAEVLKKDAGWTGPLNSSVRFVVAAMLLRADMSPEDFCAEAERVELLFKDHKLSRGTTYSRLAALLLIEHGRNSGERTNSERLRRFAALYAEMKSHHLFLTGQDDYPTCALLSCLDGSPTEIAQRCEVFYDGLRDLGFSRGNSLQTVSHMLVLAPGNHSAVMQRFRRLYDSFDNSGLWMHSGDYDEIAALSFLPHDTEIVVSTVFKHRETIAKHPPRPGKELSFSLSCSTGFLELAGDKQMNEQLRDTQNLLALQAIIQAQQAAMMAAALSASTAASGSH